MKKISKFSKSLVSKFKKGNISKGIAMVALPTLGLVALTSLMPDISLAGAHATGSAAKSYTGISDITKEVKEIVQEGGLLKSILTFGGMIFSVMMMIFQRWGYMFLGFGLVAFVTVYYRLVNGIAF